MVLWLAWLNLVGLPHRSLQLRRRSTWTWESTNHAVYAEKSKRSVLRPSALLWRPRLAKVLSTVGRVVYYWPCCRLHPDIRNALWVVYTRSALFVLCPCLSYESKQIFLSTLSRIYFVIEDTTLMKVWELKSTLLSIFIVVVDTTQWLSITLAIHI